MKIFSIVSVLLFWISGTATSAPPVLQELPKYQTPTPVPGYRNWYITQNLGATGARGWIYGADGDTEGSREIQIKSIEPGSPADGKLRLHDLIIGAAIPPETPSTEWKSNPPVRPFVFDCRLEFARAITWAETEVGKGDLKLQVIRDGKKGVVTVKIPVMGSYGDSAPFDCPKSEKIVANAARFLATSMPADGYSPGIGSPNNAMFLLATEDPRFFDHVRRSAYRMSVNHTVNEAGHETWRWGNTHLFLCEYYLATGDERVLPTIKEYAQRLTAGQSNPGTWGHRLVENFIPPGYGVVNSTGILCFLSLVLADQCGVEFDKIGLRNSIQFYGAYVGKGGLPYGDHAPYLDPSSNGKNGAAAIAFYLLGAEKAAEWFGRMALSTDLKSFEGGHSGNYFNQTWNPLGVSFTGRDNYSGFWKRFNSYRDLARRRDGSFITQPWPQKREGDLGMGNYTRKGPMWTTGGFALSYLADSKSLAILGRTKSVFGGNVPSELKPALDFFRVKKFSECAEVAEKIAAGNHSDAAEMARQLVGISRRNIASAEITLKSMQANLEAGDLYTMKLQLEAIESIMDLSDSRLKEFQDALDHPKIELIMREGRRFDQARSAIRLAGVKGFEYVTSLGSPRNRISHELINSLRKSGKTQYRKLAAEHQKKFSYEKAESHVALLRDANWKSISTPKKIDKNWAEPRLIERGWDEVSLSDSGLTGKHLLRKTFKVKEPKKIDLLKFSYRTGGPMKAYLNGTLIMYIDPKSNKTKYDKAEITLKKLTNKLLKKGENTLAVEVNHPAGPGKLELNLKALMKDG